MKHNQSSEDYLETILLLSKELEDVHQIEIARRLKVSQPAVQKALRVLKGKGYIVQGNSYAERVYHRHCTIRTFLIAHGVEYETADIDACEIEHVISQQTFEAMEKFTEKNKAMH